MRFLNWGATQDEIEAVLPGDELIPDPAASTTLAITIATPARDVWAWLVQIGQGRGGMYSYDWIENAIGLDIHSIRHIQSTLQNLQLSDRITLVRPGWLGIKAGYTLPVVNIEAEQTLVLRQSPPEHPWNAIWSFHLVKLGEDECRLLSRSRAEQRRGGLGYLDKLSSALMAPVTLAMTRKMLLGIKERAESRGS